MLKRRQTPAAHRISSDYVDGRRVAHFSREIAAQCEVNTREADKYESKEGYDPWNRATHLFGDGIERDDGCRGRDSRQRPDFPADGRERRGASCPDLPPIRRAAIWNAGKPVRSRSRSVAGPGGRLGVNPGHPAPWGPWAQPQLIFNATRDNGFGVFMHNQSFNPPGPLGPTAGTNDPNTTTGTIYAPNMVKRFTKVRANTLSIYYTMSTWNPYTVVEMRSDFNIVLPPDFSMAFDQPTITSSGGKTPVTLDVNRIGGFAGNVAITPPASTPKGIVPLIDSIATTGNSVTFKIKVKGSARPGRYPLVFAGKDESGRERDASLTLVVQ